MENSWDKHRAWVREQNARLGVESDADKILRLAALLDQKNAEIERLREGQDADRRLIAHLTRVTEAIGASPEDDPLEVAKIRMQELADSDKIIDKQNVVISELKKVLLVVRDDPGPWLPDVINRALDSIKEEK